MTTRRCSWLLLSICLAWGTVHAAQPKLVVTYPQQGSPNDYPLQVLNMALQEAGANFDLLPSDKPMPQGRVLQQLAHGRDVTVGWSMTSVERERDLLPIRIPIDKGLLGWRVLVINRNDAQRFAKIKTLDDLRSLSAGQGHDWPDMQILRGNGLPVETSTSYDGLFRMLVAGRFDYFPRSVLVVLDDEKQLASQGLEIEKTLLLHYPAAHYFFVNKKDTQLARTIEVGLTRAIANGRMERLFQQTYGDMLQRLHLPGRTRLELRNPLLPNTAPLQRKELWMQF